LSLVNDFAWHFDLNGFDVLLREETVHVIYRVTNTELFALFHERGRGTGDFTISLYPHGPGPAVWAATPSATLSERLSLIVGQAIEAAKMKAIFDREEEQRRAALEQKEAERRARQAEANARADQNRRLLRAARRWADLQALRAFRSQFVTPLSDGQSPAIANLDRMISELEADARRSISACGLSSGDCA
jgi:hypothetical protein